MQPSALRSRTSRERLLEGLAGDVARGDAAHDGLRDERQGLHDEAVQWIQATSRSIGSRSVRDARAKHQTVTAPAPERASRRAHSRAVEPDVATSSTSRMRRPGFPRTRKAPRTLDGRAAAGRRLWISVSRALTSRPAAKGRSSRRARAAAKTSAGWYPRARRARERRRHRGHLVHVRAAEALRGHRGQAGAEVVGPLELEGEQDPARRAAVGRGRAEALEIGRVEQAARAQPSRPGSRAGPRRSGCTGRPPGRAARSSSARRRLPGRAPRPAARGRRGRPTAGRIARRPAPVPSPSCPEAFPCRPP